MKEQKCYLLFSPKGNANMSHCSYYRKSVEDSFIGLFSQVPYNDWVYWYRLGYRIKKVNLTIEIL